MINFVIAHHAEAAPLIRQYQLKKVTSKQPFPVFVNEAHRLIISGTGTSNSAAATAWLAGLESLGQPAANSIWINFGIAGHADYPVGTLRCVNKITEQSTGKVWFPVQIKSVIDSCEVLTTDTVCHQYQSNCLHEMEASGFYKTALRFTTSELAQCLKMVSDNSDHPVDNIDKNKIGELISNQLPLIERYLVYLNELAREILPVDISHAESEFYLRWKFTVTQGRQLQRLLQRYCVLIGDPRGVSTTADFPDSVQKAPQVLEILHDLLSRTESVL